MADLYAGVVALGAAFGCVDRTDAGWTPGAQQMPVCMFLYWPCCGGRARFEYGPVHFNMGSSVTCYNGHLRFIAALGGVGAC